MRSDSEAPDDRVYVQRPGIREQPARSEEPNTRGVPIPRIVPTDYRDIAVGDPGRRREKICCWKLPGDFVKCERTLIENLRLTSARCHQKISVR